jgi:hypothetical protein
MEFPNFDKPAQKMQGELRLADPGESPIVIFTYSTTKAPVTLVDKCKAVDRSMRPRQAQLNQVTY